MSTVGPQLPPHLQKRKRSSSPPTPPSPTSSSSSSSEPKRQRIIGPTAPPAPLSERPSPSPSPTSSSSSSSSSSIGPSLPPAAGAAGDAHPQSARTQRHDALSLQNPEPKKPQREEWMLVPPSHNDWTSRVDPTKLRNRKFASGKGAAAAGQKQGGGGGGIDGIWTETPEQKRRRLEDEQMGRAPDASKSGGGAGAGGGGEKGGQRRREEEEDAETARRIREYNEKRGGSLLKAHQKGGKGVEEADDPSKRAFDREKDMALGGRLGEGAKRDMVKKAGEFAGRFEKGRYL